MSTSVNAPVTPSVLKWAREETGYSTNDVVTKLKRKTVQIATVEAWETGESQPTYTILKDLAKMYKRPIVLFFYPEPPPEETAQAQMSSLPRAYADELPPKIRFMIRKAVVRQLDLAEIYDDNTPEEYQRFKFEIVEEFNREIEKRDSDIFAARIRDYLGIKFEEQISWNTYDEALKRWRKAVEKAGIWVFKEAFREDRYSGFSLADEKFPVIYLNNSMSKARQIFTMFHELGHLLLGTGGVDFRGDVSEVFQGQYRRDEVFCNAFAGELLAPQEKLPRPSVRTPDDDEIREQAEIFKVSREVILRRWRDMELISTGYYRGKIADWIEEYQRKIDEKKKKAGGGGDYYATQIAYLGEKYLIQTFRQYYDNRIDEYQLADYLNVKLGKLAKLEGSLLNSG